MRKSLLAVVIATLPFISGAYVEDCDCNSGGVFGGDNGGSGADGGSGGPSDPRLSKPMNGLFTSLVTEIEFEVDYQVGAEPYTGTELLFGRLWDTFKVNVEAIFDANPKTLYIDDELSEMQRLTDVTGTAFDVGQILDIADRHRQGRDTDTRRTFYFLFLNGYFKDNTGVRQSVLGVSIGKTGVIAMFKPVIDSTSSPRRVEQTTLVHELGHAIGLVDNGLTAVDETHVDDPHGAHCTNTDCIMYWLNESSTDLMGFVARNVLNSNTVLFDDDCLNDIEQGSR